MALPPPLDSGGEGKQRVGAQSNGGGSFKPRGGKREASERQAERSWLRLIACNQKAVSRRRNESRPRSERWRCNMIIRLRSDYKQRPGFRWCSQNAIFKTFASVEVEDGLLRSHLLYRSGAR